MRNPTPATRPLAGCTPTALVGNEHSRGPTSRSRSAPPLVDLRSVMSESDLARLFAHLPAGPFYIPHRMGHRVGHRPTDSSNSTDTATPSGRASPFSAFSSPSSPVHPVAPRLHTSASTSDIRRAANSTSNRSPNLPQIQTQPLRRTTSPHVTQEPTHVLHRRASVMSMATEQDLLELAEMLSPTVEVDEADTLYSLPEIAQHQPRSISSHRISADSRITTTSSHSLASASSDDQRADYYGDSAYLSPSASSSTSFHLPRQRQRYLSDTPSLTTSDSYSTVSSPPLSRASSFQHQQIFSTPPLSPSTSHIQSPVDPNIPGLDVIHEHGYSGSPNLDANVEKALRMERGATLHSPSEGSFSEDDYTTWERIAQEDIGHLQIRPDSPETIVPAAYTASFTSSDTTSSNARVRTSSPVPQQKRTALARLFHKDTKSVDGLSDPNASGFDSKMQKAEEKKRKKQLAKERTERLAQQFQERADAKKSADGRSTKSSGGSSDKRRAVAWEEETGGMYSGASRAL